MWSRAEGPLNPPLRWGTLTRGGRQGIGWYAGRGGLGGGLRAELAVGRAAGGFGEARDAGGQGAEPGRDGAKGARRGGRGEPREADGPDLAVAADVVIELELVRQPLADAAQFHYLRRVFWQPDDGADGLQAADLRAG